MEEIEQAKALKRKSMGGEGGVNEDVDARPHLAVGKARDIIGEKIDMSGRQYDRAKYVADHGSQHVIDEVDNGERTVNSAYEELRAAKKKNEHVAASKQSQHTIKTMRTELASRPNKYRSLRRPQSRKPSRSRHPR